MALRAPRSLIRAVVYQGRVCGFVGVEPTLPHFALMFAIHFDKAVRGTPVVFEGVGRVLDELFRGSIAKVSAVLFADDEPMCTLWKQLGAEQAGYLRGQKLRNGLPVDEKLFSVHRADFMCRFLPVKTAGVM